MYFLQVKVAQSLNSLVTSSAVESGLLLHFKENTNFLSNISLPLEIIEELVGVLFLKYFN